jgi:hypothetical protein
MIAREAGRVHRELGWACPWRRPFQQTLVELSSGFGAMGKVIRQMAVREPGRSNARTGIAPDEAGDNWETAGGEAKMARPTGRGQTSALRMTRAAADLRRRRGSLCVGRPSARGGAAKRTPLHRSVAANWTDEEIYSGEREDQVAP